MAEVGAAGYAADDGVAKVSLVGAGIKSHPMVLADMFEGQSVNPFWTPRLQRLYGQLHAVALAAYASKVAGLRTRQPMRCG